MPGAAPGARPLPPGAGAYAPRFDAPGAGEAPAPAATPAPTLTYAVPPPVNGLAVASLVLGLLGLCTWGVTGLLALILGAIALRQIKERAQGGQGLALAGIIFGSISFAIGLIFLNFFVLEWFL